MKKTSMRLKRVQFLLVLAASASSAGAGYVDNYCGMQGSECITYSLTITAKDAQSGASDGDMNWQPDRVYVEINADQCTVPVGNFGATMAVEGKQPLGETTLRTPTTHTWRVPANCPYHFHMRWQQGPLGTLVGGDVIYKYDIDAATAKEDFCITWDIKSDEKSVGCHALSLDLP